MKAKKQMTLGLNQKMRLGTVIIYMGASGALVGLIVWLTMLNVGQYEDAKAAGSNYASNRTGDWSTGSTWNGGSAPSINLNGDDILINSNHTVTRGGNLSAQNNTSFTINSNGILQINGDLTVQNDLVLNVNGRLIVTGNITVQNGSNITINGGGNITTGGNINVGNNADFHVDGTLNIGGSLSFGSNAVFNGNGTVNITGSGCNQWNGAGSCNDNITLPVELLNFKAVNANGKVLITWQTASELNNDFFTIERSTNGITYEVVTKVNGVGTTKDVSSYEYIDSKPTHGPSYYRLSQTDFDGTVTVFAPISIQVISNVASTFNLYPNPALGSSINVRFTEPAEGIIEIVDNRGNSVLKEIIESSSNHIQLELNNNMQAGIYYVNYKTATSLQTVKLIKQ